jgi:hypothetical protein
MSLSQVYTKGFFEHIYRTASFSAIAMLSLVLELIHPKSVIDVGRGTEEYSCTSRWMLFTLTSEVTQIGQFA